MAINNKNNRCKWVTEDPLYIAYHDTEWGVPQYDSLNLFEMLCLEGQQAGLSWLTILKKRDNYRKIFFNFNPYKIYKLKNEDIEKFACDPGIIRHKGKISAIVNNAKMYVNLEKSGETFSTYIRKFVDMKPIINSWETNSDIPVQTAQSIALAKSLKKNGFKFVGPTICYAFMQACGLVNDHINSCMFKTQ
ncbi:DNA-3-methyladenine glycosylase 1-like isoform X1 [Aricia agestis]|uniref:DNA-3-methyladenine glycosylase 1-like isoform X1 n=1 Tax=Aricia agestis TaxID=91739 RepID=UPI001C206D66|nr:DNA-3-methyladenine glycosylase 1-like isoform X1 [Aricia agestis]